MPPNMGVMSPEKQADLLKDKGNQYFKKEKLGAAIEAYTEAITLCPSVPLYWTNRAICERKREQWEKVEADCRRALELDNHCVKAYYLLGLALVHYQQYEEAVKQLERAMDLGRGAEGNYLVPEIWQELAKAKLAEWEAISDIRSRQQLDLKLHLTDLLREDYERKLNEAIASIKAATTSAPGQNSGLRGPSQEEMDDIVNKLQGGVGDGRKSSLSGKCGYDYDWRKFFPIQTDSELERLYRSQSEPPSVIQKEKEEAEREQSAFDPLKQHKLSQSLRRGNSISIRRQRSGQFSVLSTDDRSEKPPPPGASPSPASATPTTREEGNPQPVSKRHLYPQLYPQVRTDPAPRVRDPDIRPAGPAPHARAGAAEDRNVSKTSSSESSEPPTFHSIYDVFKVFKEFMKLRQNEAGQKLLRLSELYQRRSRVLEDVFEKVAAPDIPVEIPDHLCCKITMDIFRDPVVSTSGITYERAALLDHIRKVGPFDPITRVPLSVAQIVPNLALKEAVQQYLDEHGWAYGPC
ncbi:unnamed protein product [Calypogeia fissa]